MFLTDDPTGGENDSDILSTVHTSARPAIIHILSGEGDLIAGDDAYAAVPGAWLRMPADTRHSVLARTPLVMALYLLPREDRSEP
ncbi:MAG: hypothetical protein IVW53_15630 [Chloroflexi bacterium]|nr:hypothetical protein [Chloroflexota bacterium]